jgi:hypothetical protein
MVVFCKDVPKVRQLMMYRIDAETSMIKSKTFTFLSPSPILIDEPHIPKTHLARPGADHRRNITDSHILTCVWISESVGVSTGRVG